MKFSNIRFLAKANNTGRKRNTAIIVMIVILTISMSVIPSFTSTIDRVVEGCRASYRSRLFEIEPYHQKFTKDFIQKIKNIEHVEDVFQEKGCRYVPFSLTEIDGEDVTSQEIMKKLKTTDTYIWSRQVIGDEKLKIIAGQNLDETPVFSCLVPSLFYPFDDKEENIDYIDGRTLIGKTICLKPFGKTFDMSYNYYIGDHGGNEYSHLKGIEFKMKVVGVFDCGPTSVGDYFDIFYSGDTAQAIVDQSLEATNIDWKKSTSLLAEWRRTPSLHNHYVLVDKHENVPYVYNQLRELDVSESGHLEQDSEDESANISTLLKVIGILLTIAVGISCIIIYVQNTVSSLDKRRGEVGLLKAIGYTNKQIYLSLMYETVSEFVKGFIIGGALSALFIAASNFRNNHATMHDMMYIVSWSDFLGFLGIALAFSITVPVICQLIVLKKLTKIQPREAMAAE